MLEMKKKGAFHMPENSGITVGSACWEKGQSVCVAH